MQSVEVDNIGTDVLWPALGEAASVLVNVPPWPEPRYLIGWSPWCGYGHGAVLESHLVLRHNGTGLFVCGPHKEQMGIYTFTGSEFFPQGQGRLVAPGDKVQIEFLVLNVGSPAGTGGGQANARVFSVKVTP